MVRCNVVPNLVAMSCRHHIFVFNTRHLLMVFGTKHHFYHKSRNKDTIGLWQWKIESKERILRLRILRLNKHFLNQKYLKHFKPQTDPIPPIEYGLKTKQKVGENNFENTAGISYACLPAIQSKIFEMILTFFHSFKSPSTQHANVLRPSKRLNTKIQLTYGLLNTLRGFLMATCVLFQRYIMTRLC